MKRLAADGIVVLVLVTGATALASILSFEEEWVSLRKGKVAAGTRWSDGFTLTPDGVVFAKPPKDVVHEAWLQGAPVAAGLAWRPPQALRLTLKVRGAASGKIPFTAWVRYGCDAVHWSTWQPIPPSTLSEKGTVAVFATDVSVPAVARHEYDEMMRVWWRSDPDWSSDEDELARWLVRRDPLFFARNLPFIGWLQFRLEAHSLGERLRIEALKAEISWGVGGLSSIPKSGKLDADKESRKWFLDLREPKPKPKPRPRR